MVPSLDSLYCPFCLFKEVVSVKIFIIGGEAKSGESTFGKYLREELKNYGYKPCVMHLTEPLYGYARNYFNRWPKALKERIANGTAKAIHIAFKEKAIMAAISQFSVHSQGDDILETSFCVYSEDTYISWGYLKNK